MEYLELKNNVKEEFDKEQIEDILASILVDYGFDSFSAEGDCFMAFIPKDTEHSKEEIQEVISEWAQSFEWVEHAAQNWNQVWEESFDPVEVDDFAFVYAHFHEAKPGFEHYIKITPKMSFGTGHHATTRLVMRLMKGIDFEGRSVLDIGTGTGILAILAKQLGATKIVGTEIEPWALENAEENLKMNDVNDFTLIDANVQPNNYGVYDVVIANINRNTILALKEELFADVISGGHILLSGFYDRDRQILEPVFNENGFELVRFELENDWCAMHLKKN